MFKRQLVKLQQRLNSLGRSNTEIFDRIYEQHIWAGEGDISSGLGSSVENSGAYETLIVDYVTRHGIGTIVDVGCGDFQVSRRILERLPQTVTYVGIDVSNVAIERNQRMFGSNRVSFHQADAAKQPIPDGDLVLVREVLQHIPNADIRKILLKLARFDHVIATNAMKIGAREENIDIPAGSASRAGIGSGLWLDKPPFNCQVEELLRVRHANRPTEIVTVRLLSVPDRP